MNNDIVIFMGLSMKYNLRVLSCKYSSLPIQIIVATVVSLFALLMLFQYLKKSFLNNGHEVK